MASQKGPLNTDEELKSAVIYLTNKSGRFTLIVAAQIMGWI